MELFKLMTVRELVSVCKQNRYFIAIGSRGHEIGMNGGYWKIGIKQPGVDINGYSSCRDFRPCSFMEYISFKRGSMLPRREQL